MKTILCLLLALSSHAQDFAFNKETGKAVPKFVGELKLMKGRALKTTGGRPRPVKAGERFFAKDTVATEADSSMKILISDDTWISLGPESELVFEEFDYRDKTDRTIRYELKKGQLTANVRQKVKSGDVRFRSKYATFGVRGTKLLMNYREVNGVGITEYALVEGQGEVTDAEEKVLPLTAKERLVLLRDPKKGDASLEKLGMTKEELESFVSPEADEEKDIRPFMPYYEPKALTVTSANGTSGTVEKKEASPASGSGSFDNLRKLNEQLKDNQKKKR